MPRRYERSANSNYVDGVHVKRTTWYAQLDDDVNTQLSDDGTPTDGVHILEPIAYKHAADPGFIKPKCFFCKILGA